MKLSTINFINKKVWYLTNFGSTIIQIIFNNKTNKYNFLNKVN